MELLPAHLRGAFGGNRFVALNPDGTLLWQYEGPAPFNACPTIGPDGTLYVGCDDARLYAFGE